MELEVATVDTVTPLEVVNGGLRWEVGSSASAAAQRNVGWFREEDMLAVGLTTNMRKVLAAAQKHMGVCSNSGRKRRRN